MELRPLPAEEDAVRRFTEELWLPYNRELERVVESHSLAEDVDIVAEEVPFRMERLESDDYRAWVAVDPPGDAAADAGVVDAAGTFAGFVTTELEESPSVFEWPRRLVVGDLYVTEPYRGDGLARELMGRAAERARAEDCGLVVLDVDVDNERAIAFYEKLGFEPVRHRMAVDTGEL